MTNYAGLEILFSGNPEVGNGFNVQLFRTSDDALIYTGQMYARTVRTSPFQYVIFPDNIITSEVTISGLPQTLLNLNNAFQNDHGLHFTCQRLNNNTFKIEAREFDRYILFSAFPSNVVQLSETYIYETTPAPEFEAFISGGPFQSDVNVCERAEFEVSEISGVGPFNITGLATQSGVTLPVIVDVPRYSIGSRNITIIDSESTEVVLAIPTVKQYNITGVSIINSLTGATVIINKSETVGQVDLSLQYSLDGITYGSSPSFNGILEGDYIASMADSLGCIKTFAFSVQDYSDVRPASYFNIEDANPLRFVPQPSTPFEFKTFENTLFNELPVSNIQKRYFRQPFNLGDVVKTQIKTNYRDLELNIIDCDGSVVETLVPELKIQNVGLKDKRDCVIKPGLPGKVNLAFVTGNIYDPITGDVISTYFIGNGRLPSFAQVGMTIELNTTSVTGVYLAEAIIFDTSINSWVIQIDGIFISAQESGTALSVYDIEQFDIYEVNFTLPAGQYHAEIDATDVDPNYPAIIWKSETFFFDTQEDCITIDYRSNEGMMGIDYRTLINYRLVVPGRFYKLKPAGDDESFTDDNGNKQIQKSIYIRQLELETSFLPWYLAEKVVLAVCHKDLKINGIEVVMVAKPEMDSRADQSNPFYIMKGQFEQNKQLLVTDSNGIVSGQRYVLAVGENTILEV